MTDLHKTLEEARTRLSNELQQAKQRITSDQSVETHGTNDHKDDFSSEALSSATGGDSLVVDNVAPLTAEEAGEHRDAHQAVEAYSSSPGSTLHDDTGYDPTQIDATPDTATEPAQAAGNGKPTTDSEMAIPGSPIDRDGEPYGPLR